MSNPAVLPFRPMTKADVAEVLGVCTKTIESWEKTGVIPPGQRLGAFVLWHPDVFYRWLDRRLRGDPGTVTVVEEALTSKQEQSASAPADELPSSASSVRKGTARDSSASTSAPTKKGSAKSDAGRRALERSASTVRELAGE